MKKLIIIAIAFAALAVAGCQQERFGEGVQNGVLTTITAGREAGPATRSALTEDGDNYWSVGDKILVAWAGQKPNVFTSKEKEPSETAKFQGLMSVNNSGDDTKYAIYPAEDGNLVNKDGSYALKFHAEQQGQAGTYDPDAFLAVAQSSENNLSFYNVLGLLRITFAEADCDVKSVTLRPWATPDEDEEVEEPEPDDTFDGEDDEEEEGDVEAPLIEPAVLVIIPGGVYTVEGGSAPEITDWTEDLDAIVLKAPKGETFSPEAEYYMAVPPCEFTVGVTFELEHSDGSITIVSIDNSVEVERSKIHDVFLESDPYVPVTSVDILDDEITIEVGETYPLDVTILPAKATNQYLTWSTDDYTIADISAEGVVTGVAEGTTIVYAISDDFDEDGNPIQDQVTVNVIAPEEPEVPDANGHPFVDLGLPSGLLWAKYNVGADDPTDPGDYFAWGETETKDLYGWDTYLWMDSSVNEWNGVTKYTHDDGYTDGVWYDSDGEFIGDGYTCFADLKYEDDAARANMGGTWRTPRAEEFQELIEYTNQIWVNDFEDSGVSGYIFSSLENGDIFIFLPCSGFYMESGGSSYQVANKQGFYWAGDVSNRSADAQILWFMETYDYGYPVLTSQGIRPDGHPVRGVIEGPLEAVPDDPDEPEEPEYVDLGLSSCLLWATCNMGAKSPIEVGDYYAWAEVDPKEEFSWDNYTWMTAGWESWYGLYKYSFDDMNYGAGWYNDGEQFIGDKGDGFEYIYLSDYEYEDDAAREAYGEAWSIPTPSDFQDLIDETDWEYIEDFEDSGVSGMKFSNRKDPSKYIFLPLTGFIDESGLADENWSGWYWTNSLFDNDPMSDDDPGSTASAYSFSFYGGDTPACLLQSCLRFNGLAIRPIKDPYR